jgi:DNA-binding NtrC family response regulator
MASVPQSFEYPAYRQKVEPRSSTAPSALKPPTVLLATTDLEIRSHMEGLLNHCGIKTMCARGMAEIKSALATEDIAACFCGFWLVDGTYRDAVRHLKRERPETPVVIVCAPACPNEYRDYLAALNIRAFDFICHPYRLSDLERILRSAFSLRHAAIELPASARSSDRSFRSSELRRAS